MKKVTVLGSTGSIGRQALDVIREHPDQFRVFALTAGKNSSLLQEQISEFHPCVVGMQTTDNAFVCHRDIAFFNGNEATTEIAALADSDIIINGISGYAALRPLLAALKAKKRVALANKESIVCGHTLVDAHITQYGGELLPVDSEQSAIFQCMQNGRKSEIDRLVLTASGGPFWKLPKESLINITPERALQHPTWNMGKKITIDSATLFNKGLEVIEAAYLFHMDAEEIDVLIHPQSIVHSMVSYKDGTTIANLSNPDMRLPIQYAMTYPDRIPSSCKRLSLAEIGTLTFHPADRERFRAISMAYSVLKAGKTLPTVYNGANEAAVDAFFDGKIGFSEIELAVDHALQQHDPKSADTLESIAEADRDARSSVADYCRKKRGNI